MRGTCPNKTPLRIRRYSIAFQSKSGVFIEAQHGKEVFEVQHHNTSNLTFVSSDDLNQLWHPFSQIRIFAASSVDGYL